MIRERRVRVDLLTAARYAGVGAVVRLRGNEAGDAEDEGG